MRRFSATSGVPRDPGPVLKLGRRMGSVEILRTPYFFRAAHRAKPMSI